MEPGEKRCTTCGRIGTRNFVPAIPTDSLGYLYGPWTCEFTPACYRRFSAAHPDPATRALADPPAVVDEMAIEPVDLDALTDSWTPPAP